MEVSAAASIFFQWFLDCQRRKKKAEGAISKEKWPSAASFRGLKASKVKIKYCNLNCSLMAVTRTSWQNLSTLESPKRAVLQEFETPARAKALVSTESGSLAFFLALFFYEDEQNKIYLRLSLELRTYSYSLLRDYSNC